MIIIKSSEEISQMMQAGKISSMALKLAGEAVRPGISTLEIDEIICKYIESQGAIPSTLGYNGYPACSCISVNNMVVHCVPRYDCILKEGDIVSIDITAKKNGFNCDNAWTFPCGKISEEAKKLLKVSEESLFMGIKMAKVGGKVGDIGNAVQEHVESFGFSVVRKFVGHGIGKELHEDPRIPNFGAKGKGARLIEGMTIAIEPMVNMGSPDVKILDDGWSSVTVDGKLSAHFEHTVAITRDGPIILTNPN